jgi:hypothetical protein
MVLILSSLLQLGSSSCLFLSGFLTNVLYAHDDDDDDDDV